MMRDVRDAGDGEAVNEALAFLAGHPHVFLLTRRPDGLPTGYAMTARVDEWCVLFSTYGTSAKVVNLLREGMARVLVAEEDGGTTVVEVGGPVRLVEASRWLDADADADADAGPTVAQPSPGMGPVPAEIGEKVRSRHESGKRVVVEVLVTHARRAWSLP
ncbi:MAG TPA: pyridoxamine 5'-phosphate oxidase family protein [Acidimicrobiales bacterium]|nr:pyridoxamine 5'-phosphate oxidase family protein [Acidimicrobiales bacterium]